jgi:Skp family chaperone for outer membrane proteins
MNKKGEVKKKLRVKEGCKDRLQKVSIKMSLKMLSVKEAVMRCAAEYKFDGAEALSKLLSVGKSVSGGKRVSKSKCPMPYSGEVNEECCKALRQNKGLYTQCEMSRKSGEYCKQCSASAEKNDGMPEYGTIDQRRATDIYSYVDPKGRKPISYTKVMNKLKLSEEEVKAEAEKLGITIDAGHFVVPETKRGRPAQEKAPKEPKGAKGRPKKAKKVLEIGGEEDDLFASLVAAAFPPLGKVEPNSSEPAVEVSPEVVTEVAVDVAEVAAEFVIEVVTEVETVEQNVAPDVVTIVAEVATEIAPDVAEKVAAEVAPEKKVSKKAESEAKKLEKEAKKLEKETQKAEKEAQKLEKEAKKKAELEAKEAKKKADLEAKEAKKAEKESKKAEKKPVVAAAGVKTDEEEQEVVKKIEVDGKKYLKSKSTGIIYDYNEYVTSGDQVVLGKWNEATNKIDFQESGEESEDEYDE